MIWTLFGDRERQNAIAAIRAAPDLWRVELDEPRRTDPQNRRMHAMRDDILKQYPDWFGSGIDGEDLKQIFIAAMFKELRMARSADGAGFIPLVRRSSKLSVKQLGDLMEVMAAWGADPDHPVVWREPEGIAA